MRIIDDAPCRNGNHRIVVEIEPGEHAVVGLDGENVTLQTLAKAGRSMCSCAINPDPDTDVPCIDIPLFRLLAVSPEPPKEPT